MLNCVCAPAFRWWKSLFNRSLDDCAMSLNAGMSDMVMIEVLEGVSELD